MDVLRSSQTKEPDGTFFVYGTSDDGTSLLPDRYIGSPSSIQYLLTDGHGSTQQMTDSSGNVTATFGYDAFGTALNFDAATAGTQILFGGDAIYDPVSGLYMHGDGVRDTLGFLFIQMDPTQGNNSDPISLHKYLYADADSVNSIDPSGFDGLMDYIDDVIDDVEAAATAAYNLAYEIGQGNLRSGFASALQAATTQPTTQPSGGMQVYVMVWNRSLLAHASVGHAAIFSATGQIILSEFPQTSATNWTLTSLGYNQTVNREGRLPDEVFSVYVPNGSAMLSTANSDRLKAGWGAFPWVSWSTNCVTSVAQALQAGGVPANDQTLPWIWPGDFADHMASLSTNTTAPWSVQSITTSDIPWAKN